VDKEEILEIIKEIRLKLPTTLTGKMDKGGEAEDTLEAQKEANNIIKDAENKIASLIDEHEITKKAYEQSNEIISNAQKNARK